MRNRFKKRKKLQNALLLTFIIWAAGMVARAAPTDQTVREAIATDGSEESAAASGIFSAPDSMALLRFGLPPRPRVKPVRTQPGATMSTDNTDLYRKIFSLQGTGQWKQADDLMAGLTDNSLRGHVLLQRYIQTGSPKATFGELSDWLDRYADLPGSDRIYKMALSRKPKGVAASVLRRPVKTAGGISGYLDIFSDNSKGYASPLPRTAAQERLINRLGKHIHSALAAGAPTRALQLLGKDAAAKLLDNVEYDQLRAQIASNYFFQGKPNEAMELATASALRSGNKAPLAGWTAGLTAWQQKDFKKAAVLFELAANSPYSSSWLSAAGSYWAARSYSRAGDAGAAKPWLDRAASYPRTFYGLIALRALGRSVDLNWDIPALTSGMITRLQSIPAGQRAMALVAVGQFHMAEEELFQIKPGNDKPLTEALLAYANQAGLPALAMRLGEAVRHPGGGLYDAALYPLIPWKPRDGYKIDRALVHALVRQESRFDPWAESRSGAKGLMQLMPQTARSIAGSRARLQDPETNLDIGQNYVANLLDQQAVSTDLLSLIVAYNAGPGNLRRWKEAAAGANDDPLLFIESIPVAETRAFAEKVMANYWIYQLRLKQPVASLDAVADGRWAQYVSLDANERHAEAGKELVLFSPVPN